MLSHWWVLLLPAFGPRCNPGFGCSSLKTKLFIFLTFMPLFVCWLVFSSVFCDHQHGRSLGRFFIFLDFLPLVLLLIVQLIFPHPGPISLGLSFTQYSSSWRGLLTLRFHEPILISQILISNFPLRHHWSFISEHTPKFMSKHLHGFADTSFNYTQDSTSSLLKMEHLMQAVFMDTVVETSISGNRWLWEGDKGYKMFVFHRWPRKKKKETKKDCFHSDSHCIKVQK